MTFQVCDLTERRFHSPDTHCPRCGRKFSEWFFWPGKGDYCWPCYHETEQIVVRQTAADAARETT